MSYSFRGSFIFNFKFPWLPFDGRGEEQGGCVAVRELLRDHHLVLRPLGAGEGDRPRRTLPPPRPGPEYRSVPEFIFTWATEMKILLPKSLPKYILYFFFWGPISFRASFLPPFLNFFLFTFIFYSLACSSFTFIQGYNKTGNILFLDGNEMGDYTNISTSLGLLTYLRIRPYNALKFHSGFRAWIKNVQFRTSVGFVEPVQEVDLRRRCGQNSGRLGGNIYLIYHIHMSNNNRANLENFWVLLY